MAGITYTSLPISTIGYPMWDYFSKGKGVLLGAYTFGRAAYLFAVQVAGGAHRGRAGAGRPDPSAIPGGVRERRGGGLASRALGAGLPGRLDG